MKFDHRVLAVPLILALAAPAGRSGAEPATTASSEAYAVRAAFLTGENETALAPIGDITGTAPPSYELSTTMPSVTASLLLDGNPEPLPDLVVSLKGVDSKAASPGSTADSLATAEASLRSAQLTLQYFPPVPAADQEPQPFLLLSVGRLSADAGYRQVLPGGTAGSGKAQIDSLSISGGLVDGKTLSYSGSPSANTVLYQSPTVVIYLDRQIQQGSADCETPVNGCVFDVQGQITNAIDIRLHDAKLGSRTVSGLIVVGHAAAGGGSGLQAGSE
jgi:hypothetical protein